MPDGLVAMLQLWVLPLAVKSVANDFCLFEFLPVGFFAPMFDVSVTMTDQMILLSEMDPGNPASGCNILPNISGEQCCLQC